MKFKKHKKDEIRVGFLENLDRLAKEAVDLKIAVDVYGEVGRTSLISKLHSELCDEGGRLVEIDSREITDARVLGGFYAVKEGDVEYMKGLLIESMVSGDWILFKRIDKNHGLLQYLFTVIKYRRLLGNDGEEVLAHDNFRIFFTSDDRFDMDDVVFVGPLSFVFEEAIEMFEAQCTRRLLTKVFRDISADLKVCTKDKEGECRKSCPKRICGNNEWCLSEGSVVCGPHFRSLLKIKKRMGSSNRAGVEERVRAYQSVCNVLLKHESDSLRCALTLTEIPSISLHGIGFAKTSCVEWGLFNLLWNIRNNDHTLLIGDTGVGKTSMIQYLSLKSHFFLGTQAKLRIVNMSADFDGTDLIGGYGTLDMNKAIEKICNEQRVSVPVCYGNKEKLEWLRNRISSKAGDGTDLEAVTKRIDGLLKLLEKRAHFVYKRGILTECMVNGEWLLLDEINLSSEETLNLIDGVLGKKEIFLYESGDLRPLRIHPGFLLFGCMNPGGDFGKKKYEGIEFNAVHIYDFSTSLKDINLVVHSVLRYEISEERKSKIGEFFLELKSKVLGKELSNVVEPLVSGRSLVRVLNFIRNSGEREFCKSVYEAFDLFVFTQLDFVSRSIAVSLLSKYFAVLPESTEKTKVKHGFVLTPRIQTYLRTMRQAILSNCPLLLQGDTSTGKTSMILFLSREMCRRVIRINNHEHTEAADYIGSFASTSDGIEFKEGALVGAMRRGDWVILDELNLACSDVLEVLNRLLDDNRQIYIPETDEVVVPHENFRIFATQNIGYGGRKGLSKAFRNRFVEMFFCENGEDEILEILHGGSELPKSFCKKMVEVYSGLRSRRSINALITLRDLFKWSGRIPTCMDEVCFLGMSMIYERQREPEDRVRVGQVFSESFGEASVERYKKVIAGKEEKCEGERMAGKCDVTLREAFLVIEKLYAGNFVLTDTFRRLINLMILAWESKEPILIVGETGIGKTKACDIASSVFKTRLITLSMHRGIESSDFIGSFVFENSKIVWKDGPLVKAMKCGDAFLIDEINLAEDSVLERLNSVLESQRTLYITETGEEVVAHDGFRILATMNPGGDFGKRELSPALRNRFTEMYFEVSSDEAPLIFDYLVDKRFREVDIPKKSTETFKYLARSLNVSIRKLELIVEFIYRRYMGEFSGVACAEAGLDVKSVWEEALEVAGIKGIEADVNARYFEDERMFGVLPYLVEHHSSSSFDFESPTSTVNLRRILRAMGLGRGTMLEGDPGIGKTSIIQGLARKMGKKCIRINLSEQTELCDLVGSYLPVDGEIRFMESELLHSLRDGGWIILDEINLCTQSVIEGLNSVLDYRRKLFIPEVTVDVHEDTRIFATLNPCDSRNGRKMLPKSFLDRFVRIKMDGYTTDDITHILNKMFPSPMIVSSTSLRENIRMNRVGTLEDGDTSYFIDESVVRVGSVAVEMKERRPRLDFVLIHSQLQGLEMIMRCIEMNIPLIISGGVGKDSLLRFVSSVFGQEMTLFNCHKDTDVCDLLGQYQKMQNGMFEWCDSAVVSSVKEGKMVVFAGVEFVEKSVFDRLNSLFESERTLNVYERGVDTNVAVNPLTRLVLVAKEPGMLSPALLDRCMHVELSDRLNYIDLWKLFVKFPIDGGPVFCRDFCGLSMKSRPLSFGLDLKRFRMLGIWPDFLSKHLCGVYNTLEEREIDRLFRFRNKSIPNTKIDVELLNFYRRIELCIYMPHDDESRMKLLRSMGAMNSETQKAVAFIKSASLSVFSPFCNDEKCSLNFPRSSKDLKMKVIRSLRDKKFSEYRKLKTIAEHLPEVRWEFLPEFDEFYFEFIERCQNDPLSMVREGLVVEMNEFENKSLTAIHDVMKHMYKYGKGSVEEMVEDYERGIKEYKIKIRDVEKKMGRDYARFKESLKDLNFCSYMCGDRLFYEGFGDVFDYYLIYMFCKWINGEECSGKCKIRRLGESCLEYRDVGIRYGDSESGSYVSYSILCLNLIRLGLGILPHLEKIDCKGLDHEFSRYLNSLYYSRPTDKCSLMLEGTIFDKMVHAKETSWIDNLLELEEKDLDDCLRSIFNRKTRVRVIESDASRLEIAGELVEFMDQEMQELPIFTSAACLMEYAQRKITDPECYGALLPENMDDADPSGNQILESTIVIGGHLKEKGFTGNEDSQVHRIVEVLERLYKDTSACDVDRNYRYFLYLVITPFSFEMAERYFLDCSVYEFVDRVGHAREMAIKDGNPVFYNVTLKYVSFEVERLYEDRIRDAKSKLKKEPKLYKKILEDLKKFLILPVTNVLDLKFPQLYPGCQGYHPDVYTYILKNRSDCECRDWIEFAKKFDRREVQNAFGGNKIKRKDVLELFFNRIPKEMFSNSEVCLGKVVNQMVEDTTLMNLTRMCIENPYIPFMYFVFMFGREEEGAVEDGTGMKSGTGNINVSEQIEHEDEIDDEYGEQEKVSESDGIDFDNDGSISTASEPEEEECESGVDGWNDEEEEDDDDEKNEKECESEQNAEIDIEDEGIGSEGSLESGGEELLCSNSSEGNESSEIEEDDVESGGESDARSQDAEDLDSYNKPEANEYQFKEGVLNKNQTCEVAENYERYVAGKNPDDNALCAGEGSERVSGDDDDSGSGDVFESTVRIRIEDQDCTKLTNLLRIIMESKRGNRYRGDFRSGKKLNMKRLVPYIASGFRRDRIWMRRQRNDKKEYVLRLFIDNSKSMYSQEMIDTLLSLYSKINRSFSLLGIPVEVYRFGEVLERCPVEEMRFNDSRTMVDWIDEFNDGINIILTDGLFQNAGYNHPNFLVLLVDKCDVRKMSKVIVSEGSIFVQRYLDTFPFKYCIISGVDELESTFIMALSELISS
ncbi:AAA ATPase [Encephalitozoon cuniculi EcunIII-L]|uniref:Midasin n=1 Tax=Encephalitozoon cuniculi TaxID=6035 RepID=M1K2L6_ENCCN|nr:putative protein of the cbbq/norq/nirq/gvpn family [Encephalitozoon cuniculi]KMV65714.1 AAA ATPase [Encephalitozoon cuniculi EcunIII-L]